MKQDLSQKDVGAKLGISQRSYAYYEDGTRIPKYGRLMELGAILGIDKEKLLAPFQTATETKDSNVDSSQMVFPASEEELSQNQIILMLAQANKDYAEGFKALARVVERIEKNMARQESQAKMEANLNEALAGIETLSVDSEKIMADLASLKAGRNGSSEDADNK